MGLRFILLLVFWMLISPVWAAETSLENVVAALETPFKTAAPTGIEDFQAEFFQLSRIASIDKQQQAHGEVSFKFQRPEGEAPVAMFRWSYLEPTIQEFISDGNSLWVYQPENRQVIESEIEQSNNPLAFLNRLGELSQDFTIGWGAPQMNESGDYLLVLEPRRETQLARSLQIVVSSAAVKDFLQHQQIGKFFPLKSVSVIDPNQNLSRFRFESVRMNQHLSPDIFRFQPPEGVEVLHPAPGQIGY